jgi:hypothetical protein
MMTMKTVLSVTAGARPRPVHLSGGMISSYFKLIITDYNFCEGPAAFIVLANSWHTGDDVYLMDSDRIDG